MAGTDRSLEPVLLPVPAIILCEPQLGENIGTAARAMANFGLWDLRLVRPRDGWPNEKAIAAASRADHVLERVRVFETLEDATAFGEEVRTHRMRIKNRTEIFGEQPILNERDEKIGEDPYFLPAATDLDLEQAATLVEAHGGICWPAHIDRDANGLLAVLGFFPPEPVFKIAELRDANNRALAGDRKIVVCSDAHRLWEIGEAGGTLTLDTDETRPETVRHALFQTLREGTL